MQVKIRTRHGMGQLSGAPNLTEMPNWLILCCCCCYCCSPSYDYMFYCKRCAAGCDVCVDESPCLSSYDWAFRISLLTITLICIVLVFILVFNIYRYRRLKVIKVASPIFLCITLLGCAIMYCEVRRMRRK